MAGKPSSVVGRVLRIPDARPSASGDEARTRHPSVPARPVRLVAFPGPSPQPVFEDGCGAGRWCESCLEEIRVEALAWIRDLNATDEEASRPVHEVRRTTGDPWSLGF